MKLSIKNLARSMVILTFASAIVACADMAEPTANENNLQQYSQLVNLYGTVSAVPAQSFDFIANNQLNTWKVVNRQYGGTGSAVISMIPSTQNLVDWQQSMVITTALSTDAPNMTIDSAMHDISAVSKKACRRVNLKILTKLATQTTFTMQNSKCKDGYKLFNEKHTITIIQGTNALHIAHYTVIENNLTPKNQIQDTENMIQNATLVPNIKPSDTSNTDNASNISSSNTTNNTSDI